MELDSIFSSTRSASRKLAALTPETVNIVLLAIAQALVDKKDYLIKENARDLERMSQEDYKYDRLLLNEDRIEGIASEIRRVATLSTPVGKIMSEQELPNGLHISRVAVPIGVIGIIYEARPNVTADAFVLCFKTLNACVLKGGSDAQFSNIAIVEIIRRVLTANGIDENVVSLLPAERRSGEVLLQAKGWVDVLIPRGSQQLIDYVRTNATLPVIETGAGIVHTYFDESADLEQGTAIVFNAKTRRISVCNALDCLVIHENRLADLAELTAPLTDKQVEIFADERAFEALTGRYPAALLKHASPEDFGTEFLAYKLAVKTVSSLDEALNHINAFGSKHSEAILSKNAEHISRFLQSVDAAAVYANTSTAFTDGAQFGLGAEIGISTQKLHARGPMGLDALTTYKWIVIGDGQIRS